MRDDDVPVKTQEGLAEIKTRTMGLAPRERTALLLVDGVKSIGELGPLLAASGVKPGTLELLIDKGLILVPEPAPEPVSEPEPAPAAPMAMPVEVAPPPKPVPVPEAAAPAAPTPAAPKAAPAPKPAPAPAPAPVAPAPVAPKPTPAAKAAPAQSKNIPSLKAPTIFDVPLESETLMQEAEALRMRVAGERDWDADDEPEDKISVPPPPADMNLVLARAHLANALDDFLDGYILKQMVAGCTSRTELESLFGAAEGVLIKSLGKNRSADVMGTVKALMSS